MLRQGQKLTQRQTLQQKLSPQQIQYIKLLQLPTLGLEQRVKQELEMNPVLEEIEEEIQEHESTDLDGEEWSAEESRDNDEPDPVDQNEEIDWDSFLHNTEYEGNS